MVHERFLHPKAAVPDDPHLAIEVVALALEIEAEQYDDQYGKSNLPAGVLAHAAQIVRGLFGGDYAYLNDEAVNRAERRSSSD